MKISVLLFASLPSAAFSSSYKNVYGNALQSCSSDGMALTGYTRTGYCVDQNDDQGSHHICINMASAAGGNFCDVTGQDDWCSSEMPCHEDQNEYCQVQQWCVCQWAFASYLENAGGCSYIQTIVCEAINMEAVLAYQKQSSNSKYQEALDCLVDRCGLDLSSSMYLHGSSGAVSSSWLRWGLVAGAVFALAGAILYLRRRRYTDIDKEARLVDQSSAPIL
jgi:uncharacterized protein (DUF2237 family)